MPGSPQASGVGAAAGAGTTRAQILGISDTLPFRMTTPSEEMIRLGQAPPFKLFAKKLYDSVYPRLRAPAPHSGAISGVQKHTGFSQI